MKKSKTKSIMEENSASVELLNQLGLDRKKAFRDNLQNTEQEILKILRLTKPKEYTISDAITVIKTKYGAKEITLDEVCDYIGYGVGYCDNYEETISTLTEGEVNADECAGIFVLPSEFMRLSPFQAKKKGIVLILNAVDNKLNSYWIDGEKGAQNIHNVLYILEGKYSNK